VGCKAHRRINWRRTQTDEQSGRIGMNGERKTMEAGIGTMRSRAFRKRLRAYSSYHDDWEHCGSSSSDCFQFFFLNNHSY